jgi:hypothetical protein
MDAATRRQVVGFRPELGKGESNARCWIKEQLREISKFSHCTRNHTSTN